MNKETENKVYVREKLHTVHVQFEVKDVATQTENDMQERNSPIKAKSRSSELQRLKELETARREKEKEEREKAEERKRYAEMHKEEIEDEYAQQMELARNKIIALVQRDIARSIIEERERKEKEEEEEVQALKEEYEAEFERKLEEYEREKERKERATRIKAQFERSKAEIEERVRRRKREEEDRKRWIVKRLPQIEEEIQKMRANEEFYRKRRLNRTKNINIEPGATQVRSRPTEVERKQTSKHQEEDSATKTESTNTEERKTDRAAERMRTLREKEAALEKLIQQQNECAERRRVHSTLKYRADRDQGTEEEEERTKEKAQQQREARKKRERQRAASANDEQSASECDRSETGSLINMLENFLYTDKNSPELAEMNQHFIESKITAKQKYIDHKLLIGQYKPMNEEQRERLKFLRAEEKKKEERRARREEHENKRE